MKWQSRLSISFRSSSLNDYDAHETATRLNESVSKVVEEARQKEFCKQTEEEVRVKPLTIELNNQWDEKEAKVENDLAQAKTMRQRDKMKVKSKMSKMWRFFKSQQARTLTAPPEITPLEDDDEDDVDEVDNRLG